MAPMRRPKKCGRRKNPPQCCRGMPPPWLLTVAITQGALHDMRSEDTWKPHQAAPCSRISTLVVGPDTHSLLQAVTSAPQRVQSSRGASFRCHCLPPRPLPCCRFPACHVVVLLTVHVPHACSSGNALHVCSIPFHSIIINCYGIILVMDMYCQHQLRYATQISFVTLMP